MFFDITPSIVTAEGAIFYVELGEDFIFSGACISVA
jgi:hypothetical protein